jgi:hypothetical protein
MPGFCSRGFRPLPSAGTGSSLVKGLLGPVRAKRKNISPRKNRIQN